MSSISRRRFLQGATALSLGTILPAGFATSAYAFPWVAVALAAGSFVAGMIASHNRRNIDAYIQGAIREELRVATLQLASLQAGVSVVLNELSKLPDFIEQALVRRSVLDAHAKIKAEIGLYIEEIGARNEYANDKEWFSASRRADRLNAILDNLARNRQFLFNLSDPSDPTSAIVMSSAALVEINLMNVGNILSNVYDEQTILYALRGYEDYFASVKAGGQGSAAWYLAQHELARKELVDKLQRNSLWQQLEQSKSMFNCAQVRAFAPPAYPSSNHVVFALHPRATPHACRRALPSKFTRSASALAFIEYRLSRYRR